MLRSGLVHVRHRHRAWQFYLWFSLVAAIGNGLGYNPALTTGQKWFIDKKGLASGITLAASTAGPAVLSPVLASLLIPSLGIFGALKALGVIFFVMIAASALFLKAPEAGWLPEGFEAPKGARTPAPSATSPRARWSRPRASGSSSSPSPLLPLQAPCSWARLLHRRRPALHRPHERRGRRPRRCGGLRQHLRQPGRPSVLWPDHRQARRLQVAAHQLVVTIVALVIMSISFTQSMFFVALALLGFSFGALLVIYRRSPVAPSVPATSASTTASCSWLRRFYLDQPAHHCRAVSR